MPQTVPEATIVHRESTKVLERLLPVLPTEPALFWLDAHSPASFDQPETEATRYPLLDERRLIQAYRLGWQRDVIAIDDLRVIRDPHNPRWRPGELKGRHAALYQDVTLAEVCAPFAATHEVACLAAATGVLLLLPRAA